MRTFQVEQEVDGDTMDYEDHIYENIVRIDNVQIIDHRIIRIVNRVHEAPLQIQQETEKFIRYIDNLKKAYVKSIVKRKKAERRYSEAISNYELCEQEYKTFRQSQEDLLQFGDEIEDAAKQLDKSHIELILARNILDACERELLLHREQLSLLSKKAEHTYIFFLRKTADKYWADMYMRELVDYETAELPPPQFIYQQELIQQNTPSLESEESEDIITTSEEGFEWDTTYDEHFHRYDQDIHVESRRRNAPIYRQSSVDDDDDMVKHIDNYDSDNDDINHDVYNSDKVKLYTSEPLYEDLFIYRRRCTLVRRMKPTRLIRYLKNVVHGPWEGWEDL